MSFLFRRKKRQLKYKIRYGKSPLLRNKKEGSKNYQNFTKRISPRAAKAKRLFTTALITAIVILLIYGLFFSDYFKITKIEVPEQTFDKETLTAEIEASITSVLGKNIIFVDTQELELKIISVFPELEEVSIEKDYPRTVIVNFSEYPLVANVINESSTIKKSYIINSIGYAIKEDLENPALPYIQMESDEPINTENPTIEATKLTYILDAITYFEDKFGMKINEVHYMKTARELHLLTEKDFFIWLDIQRPAEEQLKKLKKALIKLDIYTANLEYIDLRIAGSNGDKIIYKRRNP